MVTAASERARGGKNNLRGLVISRVSESEGSESFAAGNVMDSMRMMMVPMLLGGAMIAAHAAAADPFAGLDSSARAKTNNAADPFADLEPAKSPVANTNRVSAIPVTDGAAAKRGFFGENFTFKNEIMAEFSYSAEANREQRNSLPGLYSRNSVGFEVLKKFSTATATVAAFDFQARLVRRDGFHEVVNDMAGGAHRGWQYFELHNLYVDFYNVFDPLLSDAAQSDNIGRFNLRAGHFYQPFGLNLQTDTHGTLLQLSNERNFGSERDWYAGFWGSLNSSVNYDAYYLLGSGYDIRFRGQSGLVGARLSLANRFLNEYGIEGGISYLGGERLGREAVERSASVARESRGRDLVATQRGGVDARYSHAIPTGSLALATELSTGFDEADRIYTQLYQLDYLTRKRKFGASAQYRRFSQRMGPMLPAAAGSAWAWGADASVIGEVTWYFRNDLGNANLHWIKLNVERQTEKMAGARDTIVTMQYYRYF